MEGREGGGVGEVGGWNGCIKQVRADFTWDGSASRRTIS